MKGHDQLPNRSELENVGHDHTRHRAFQGWLSEAFWLCLASFVLSTLDVASGFAKTGLPTFPRLISSILFGFALASLPVAFRSLGKQSTLSTKQKRSWRTKLIVAAALALLPVIIGCVGQIIRTALAADT